jgi:ADP-ribosyl-[dinitrogen reductase] hydrolase
LKSGGFATFAAARDKTLPSPPPACFPSSVLDADKLSGVLLGTAVGDSLGLPTENLSPRRLAKLFPGALRHRLLPGTGMVSDDTEHTALTALSLLDAPDDPDRFARRLAWRLRFWFVCLPAGVGMATARACIKLWLGFPPSKSGVVSGGNGPSMRSALLGVYFKDEPELRRRYVTASAELTHRGPQALVGALAVAELAAMEANGRVELDQLAALSTETFWTEPFAKLRQQLINGSSTSDFAKALGCENGVTGYSMHSVPVALYAWLRHKPDATAALASAIQCGGDTDSVGAVVGAIAGAALGTRAFPAPLTQGIRDWPWSTTRLRSLGEALAARSSAPLTPWPLVALRNLGFLAVVLTHGIRRLFPPY